VRGLHDELVEYRTHFRWAVLCVVVAFALLSLRFFQLQVIEGETYEALATVSTVVRDRVVPARGTLRDRGGEVLAMDVEVTDLMVVPMYVKDVPREIGRLVELGVFTEARASEIRTLIETALGGAKKSHRLVAHKGLVGSRCPADLSPMSFDASRGRLVCPQCGSEHVDQRAVVQTHLHELPGFSLRGRTLRHHPAHSVAAHVVGFVNEASEAEIERHRGRLKPGDTIGRSGMERALDETLRGMAGEDVWVRGPGGRRLAPEELPEPYRDVRPTPPVPGRDVTLTLDLALQRVAFDALKEYPSGAVVALEADTGEVLAMASWPSFDPGPVLVPEPDADGRPMDPVYAPMMNKAVSAYPCGSTFKMITAIAALNEGLIVEDSEAWCPGFYVFRGHKFKCFRQYGHGKIRLIRALAESCDTYFYQLGELLGQDNLAHYARDVFGLGEKTGIELAEDPGLIPTERWYRRHRGFQPGFAINTSVGQGDVKVTPLALARAYAALVNGGKLMRPRLVKAVADAAGGMRAVEPEVMRVLDIPETYVETVLAGLFGAVNFEAGTARSARIRELPFGGKTGTAQAREVRRNVSSSAIASWLLQDHAWFVGYAPAKRPRIVVAAFVEHGGFGGAVAAPVAKKVIQAWYAEHADELSDLWLGGQEPEGDDPPLEIVR
jgi:penicillin-binding protein 2